MLTDHTRGCQGREYTCTCGYDDQQEAEIERLRSELSTARKRALEEAAGYHDDLAGNMTWQWTIGPRKTTT